MLRAAAGQGPVRTGLSHLGSHLPCCNGENFSLAAPTTASRPKHPVSTDPSSGPSLAPRTPRAHTRGTLPQEPRRRNTNPKVLQVHSII